ncbi:hypothetical protein D9M72_382150 [compost metagenome]
MRDSSFKTCNQRRCLLDVQLDLRVRRYRIVCEHFVRRLVGNVEIRVDLPSLEIDVARVNVRGDLQKSLPIANIVEADLVGAHVSSFRLGAGG